MFGDVPRVNLTWTRMCFFQSKRVRDKEVEMSAKVWQKEEKLRQLKEIVQVQY